MYIHIYVYVHNDQVILPTMCAFLPLFRNILIRERIDIVHGHQSTSVMANECILYARTIGIDALLL
jgi:phosphatidylinositol glycan class A protein